VFCHANQLAGLVGPLAIYAKGKLDNPGVDLEIPLLYNIQNEMQSFYFEVGGMSALDGPALDGPVRVNHNGIAHCVLRSPSNTGSNLAL
jgi:hypothetical protein